MAAFGVSVIGNILPVVSKRIRLGFISTGVNDYNVDRNCPNYLDSFTVIRVIEIVALRTLLSKWYINLLTCVTLRQISRSNKVISQVSSLDKITMHFCHV